MSISASAEARAQAPESRLHLVSVLQQHAERNRVRSILANQLVSARRRIAVAADTTLNWAPVVRALGWLSRLRNSLRPAISMARRCGIALPIWLATSTTAQRGMASAARIAGRAILALWYGAGDAIQWALWHFGVRGQALARRNGEFVVWVHEGTQTLAKRIAGWLHLAAAEQTWVRITHDASFAVIVARQLVAVVPAPWRLLVGVMSLLLAGGLARRHVVLGTRWLAKRIASGFNSLRLPKSAPTAPTHPLVPSSPTRPATPRSTHQARNKRRR